MTAPDLAELVRELPRALGPYVRVARRAVRAGMQAAPVADAAVEVLRVVEAQPGVSVGRVAERLGVAPNTVSTHRQASSARRGWSSGGATTATAGRPRCTSRRTRTSGWPRGAGCATRCSPRRCCACPQPEREDLREALPAVRHLLEVLEQLGQERAAAVSSGTRTAAALEP